MTNSMWLIVASMLATVAGVVVQKIVESIIGQQSKLQLEKERAKLNAEYTLIRKQLQTKIEDLEEQVSSLQQENITLLKECHKLELDFLFCKKQFEWLKKCNPEMFEHCPTFGPLDDD